MLDYIPFDMEKTMMMFDTKAQYDVESIVKLHIIERQYEDGSYLNILNKHSSAIEHIPQVCGKFASTINSDNIRSQFGRLPYEYHDGFLDYTNKYGIYKRIDWNTFKEIFRGSCKYDIFKCRSIVKHYDNELLKWIENDSDLIEMLIQDALELDRGSDKKLFLPTKLTPEKKEELVVKYISGINANPNFMRLIFNSRGTEDFPISDNTRLLAKKRYSEYWKPYLNNKIGSDFECTVTFTPSAECEERTEFDAESIHLIYSLKWIENNLDFPTLLNNFIYLFKYCDLYYRMKFPSMERESGVFESIMGMWGKNDYFTTHAFHIKNMVYALQMKAYCCELEKHGIDIHDIFKWFFSEYLDIEFNAKGFVYIPPTKHTSYLEKCILLSCAIDGILKQFNMYSLNGCIDRDLLEISSNHIDFGSIKGFIDGKYVYSKCPDIEREKDMLFSRQSLLHYTDKTKYKYDSFYSMLQDGTVKLEDFREYQARDIEWLASRGAVSIDTENRIILNKERAAVLKKLYYSDVICYSYMKGYKNTIDEMIAAGELFIESTLFSRKEQDYLNYMLNNSRFGNGPALRNNYVHGTHSLNEQKHENDYYELLKIMTMIVLKINEEFCLKYPENKDER